MTALITSLEAAERGSSSALWSAIRQVRDFIEDEVQGRMEAGGGQTDYLREAEQTQKAFEMITAALRAVEAG